MKMSAEKAKKILKDGMVRGKRLSAAQKRLFGLIAGGGRPTKADKRKKAGKHDSAAIQERLGAEAAMGVRRGS